METRAFYYSKPTGITLFIAYLFMTAGFTYATTIAGESALYYLFMWLMVAFGVAVLYYVLKKWILPAYRNEPALTLDDKVLDLKNKYLPIAWTEIDSLVYRSGKYGNVIGIKLKDLDEFLSKQPTIRKGLGLKINQRFYGFHFGISTTTIKGDTQAMFDTLNDFFNRYRLGAPAFFFKDSNVEPD